MAHTRESQIQIEKLMVLQAQTEFSDQPQHSQVLPITYECIPSAYLARTQVWRSVPWTFLKDRRLCQVFKVPDSHAWRVRCVQVVASRRQNWRAKDPGANFVLNFEEAVSNITAPGCNIVLFF